MNGCMKAALVLASCLASLPTASAAAMIVQHQGSTNPGSEGWYWYTQGSEVTTGAVTNDDGRNAYYTQDSNASASASGSWRYALSSTQTSRMQSIGWTLSADVNVVGSSSPLDGSLAIYMCDTSKVWQLGFGSTAGGNAVVQTLEGQSYTCSSGGYHLYEVSYVPSTGAATVRVDGIARISGWAGSQGYPQGLLSWGAAPSYGTARGNWSLVSLVVPEPSSTAMLGGALLGLAGALLRRARSPA